MDESLESLVRGAQNGDREAFVSLIGRFERTALAVAFAVLAEGDAAGDAVQDAFLRAWQRLGELREPRRFGAWLCGIVRNSARDVRRRGRRECQVLADVACGASEETQADPVQEVEYRETGQRIARALELLDDVSRAAVVLRYYDNLGSRQIGELLDLAPAAVDMRLMRARQFLRRQLGEEIHD